MATRPWNEEDDALLKRLHAQGLPLNQLWKQTEFSRATVGAKAKKLGLSFDRAPMEAAIKASQVDRRARRAALTERWLTVMEEHTSRIENVGASKSFTTTAKELGGVEVRVELDYVPPSDLRYVVQSLSQLATAMVNLEKVDQDGGMSEARGLVGSLLALITASVSSEERLNPTAGVAK